jgi:3-isopropylmalate/(R)-2-methylmalate dehydratase small subunit
VEPFTRITAIAAPLDIANVNTDQIFPARYIKKPRGPGYKAFCFHDLRLDDDGRERPDFPLNRPRFRNARILVAGPNFGCGSSREGAVYALQDYGFRVLIAPSFGDIFAANCVKNGVLALRLPTARTDALRRELADAATPTMTVDLKAQRITRAGGGVIDFEIDPFEKECLLQGLNEIDLSLRHADEIEAFERDYRDRFPWLFSPLKPASPGAAE